MSLGQKALSSITALLIGCGFAALKGDLPPNLLSLVEFVLGAFITGNVAAGISQGVAETIQHKNTSAVENTKIQAAAMQGGASPVLQQIADQQKTLVDSAAITQQGIISLIQAVSKK